MGVSLDAIYQPLNDFFVKEFGQSEGSPVMFRFARTARTLLDSDFVPAAHPEFGPSPALAEQVFSALVDGIPMLDPDGRTVWIGPGLLSDLYHDEVLGPSLPYLPAAGNSDADRQAVIDAFSQVKADAALDWEHSKAASLFPGEEGTVFRPSTPAPQSWWNRSEAGAWTSRSFEITGGATIPGHPVDDGILRLKLDDVQARKILLERFQSPPIVVRPEPSASLAVKRPMMMMAASAEIQPHASLMMARPGLASSAAALAVRERPRPLPVPSAANRIDAANFSNAHVLPLRERLVVQSTLGEAAPTQAVVSTNVTISFDYCVVRATRPWMHDAFLHARNWHIPGMAKGELSANDGHGMPAIPVGFVAIKALSIKAPWTPVDINNLQLSVQFGPFKFDSTVVNGAIGHEGVQIVGWLLRDTQPLPPNDPA